ncbi:serine threonine kinase, CMGC group, partial [Lecanosticta acicola]
IALLERVEEETLLDYVSSYYYSTNISKDLRDRYQIVGKLGYGASSTIWLARDLSGKRHVVLKLFITSSSLGKHLDDEINIYKRLEARSHAHPGREAVRQLLDTFDLEVLDGQHRCLVHPPLWESVLAFLGRDPIGRLPVPVLAFTLKRLFLALDFLHSECNVIHADIKADNIMFGIRDEDVFEKYEGLELRDPSPRKVLDDRSIYISRNLNLPKQWGAPVLCDFGSAITGDVEHTEDIQPNIYRPPPLDLLARGSASEKFFTQDDRELFLSFMRKMLQWDPSKRHSAKALADDEWIRKSM